MPLSSDAPPNGLPEPAGLLPRPDLGLRFQSLPPLCFADPAILQIVPRDRALSCRVPGREPVTERITEPRRLRAQRLEAELVPDRLRALHIGLLGQRERRHVALHGGV